MFVLVLIELASIPVLLFYIPVLQPIGMPLDIDYIPEGEFAGKFLVSDNSGHVSIIGPRLRSFWRCDLPHVFVHEAEMLPNGNIIIADTGGERVIEVNIDDPTDIVWEWDPKNPDHVNWTEFAISVGWSDDALEYVQDMTPPDGDWSHINDVEWINGTRFGRNHDSFLISLRNFNVVLEVNYTDTKEIIWHYGEPENTDVLFRQHNPDMRENGNVIICDSENRRIVELNYTTKAVVWEFSLDFPAGALRWARDCDDLGNGTYLITDSLNGRVLVVDRETQEIIREYGKDFLIQPYESDLTVIDGELKILVGDSPLTVIAIVDFVDGSPEYIGYPFIASLLRFPVGLLAIYYLIMFLSAFRNTGGMDIKSRLTHPTVYREIFHFIFMVILFWLLGALFRYLMNFGLFPILDRIMGIYAHG
jgi:hypothetical protein